MSFPIYHLSFSPVDHCPRVAIYSAGARGNYILDATSFLEFLPTNKAWLVTFMSIWWAVGYTITGLFAWDFMSNYSCDPDATIATCTRADNMGWRYLHFTCGAVVLTMALARLFLIRMVQTPRWLLSQNRDEEVITVLDDIATKYKRTHSLTLNQLQTQGTIVHTEKLVWSSLRIKMHFKRLFQTQKLGWSTTVILANWFVIGMVHQLYSVFLPFYLESRGADTGDNSNYTIWRNYAVNQVAGLIGPAIAAVLVETDFVGRRGTLAIGALITMVLQFRTIYAYTPEILPSAHRATSYGLCVVVNRVGGILGVLVGSYANVETTAPLFVCAALFGLLVVLSLLLPFESKGRRSQ